MSSEPDVGIELGKTETALLLPVREFPDRGTRWLLESPENVRGLLQTLDAAIADRIDFARSQQQRTSFVLDHLRKQESDVLFLVPLKDAPGEHNLLVYILIEHQSEPVMAMGFRLLFYMTLIWDRQRQEWERQGIPESQWRFYPILPVLFYTGASRWTTPLSMTALMELPEEWKRFVPSHETLFLNLPMTAPEQLTVREHVFGWIARVLRKEKASTRELIDELRQAVARIEALTVEQRSEWLRAMHYLLLLIHHRREPEEHQEFTDIILESVQNRSRQEEVSQMGRTIAQTLIEEGKEIGMKLGFEEGIERGIERGQIANTRSNLLDVLNACFTVPYAQLTQLKERIQRIEDLSVLHRLLMDAVKAESLEAFVKRLDELQV